jgi:uncharacterized protein
MAERDVLVDTTGSWPFWEASDEHHDRAVRLQSALSFKNRQFLTTDYIVDETATLLLMRHSHAAAADFLKTTIESGTLRLEWIDSDRFQAAAELFQRHKDKEWSFTDCVSFSLMRELKIRDSFTTDHHFLDPLLRSAGLKP